jgi:hypothetical protein
MTIIGLFGYQSFKEWKADSELRTSAQAQTIAQLGAQVSLGLSNLQAGLTSTDRLSEAFTKRARDIDADHVRGLFETHATLLRIQAEEIMGLAGKDATPDPLTASRSLELFQLLLKKEELLLQPLPQTSVFAGPETLAAQEIRRHQAALVRAYRAFFTTSQALSALGDLTASSRIELQANARRLADDAPTVVALAKEIQSGDPSALPAWQEDAAFWRNVEAFGHYCDGVAHKEIVDFGDEHADRSASRAIQQFDLAATMNRDLAWAAWLNAGNLESTLAESAGFAGRLPEVSAHRKSAMRFFDAAGAANRLHEHVSFVENLSADLMMQEAYESYQRASSKAPMPPDGRAKTIVDAFEEAAAAERRIRQVLLRSPTHSIPYRVTYVEIRCLQLLIRFYIDSSAYQALVNGATKEERTVLERIHDDIVKEKTDGQTDYARASDHARWRELFREHLDNVRAVGVSKLYESGQLTRDNFFKCFPTLTFWLNNRFSDVQNIGGVTPRSEMLNAVFPH